MKRNYYSRYEISLPEEGQTTALKEDTGGILSSLFSRFAVDDLILLAVILILITDEKPDMITVLALLYIFLV